MWFTNIYSNIINSISEYIGTSIKVGCATSSLYASSGPNAEGVPTNKRGRKRAKHNAYNPLDDQWVMLSSSKAFDYF